MAIAGTRPEIIKLVPVMRALEDEPVLRPSFCHSGQHADLGRDLLNIAGITPDEMLERPSGEGVDRLLAGMIETIGAALDRHCPRAVIVQGDTATMLAGAMAAFHRRIPVAHVEAGLRSADMTQPFPEEAYRRLVTPLARWHFAPTKAARNALIGENIAKDSIKVVGNTVVDALHWACSRLDADPSLGAEAHRYIAAAGGHALVLATVHRREHDTSALKAIAYGLLSLAERRDVRIVLPLHPRAESAILRELLADMPRIELIPAVDYFTFLRLMRASRLVVSDSGGVQKAATAMGRPVLVLRKVTERMEAVGAGAARLVGHDRDLIAAAANEVLSQPMPEPSDVFGDGRASERIARTLRGDLYPR